MLYPRNIEEKIGFDRIKSLVAAECTLDSSKARAEKIRFGTNTEHIIQQLSLIDEFGSILETGTVPPASYMDDIGPMLKEIETEGTYLEGEKLLRISRVISTAADLVGFFKKNKDKWKALAGFSEIQVDRSTSILIESKIDENGNVRDNASSELKDIRKSIQAASTKARTSINRIFKHATSKKWVPKGLNISVRDGRLVIPLHAEFKRQLKGFIHDESATGQTVYVEPADVLELNNRIKELHYHERKEMIRVLKELSSTLRIRMPSLVEVDNYISTIDFITGAAKFSISINAVKPHLSEEKLKLINARHPLLMIAFNTSGRQVVPLNIELDENDRILLISGPNAGGKSVCLKTVGLLQYMVQAGLPVPVQEGSTFPVFEDLFVDIGDEQSIENDLSTYSSHLTNLKAMLASAGKSSLILIDEFGSGTEPHFGGALAQAVLGQLLNSQARGVITTHYNNLKEFAQKKKGIMNGAMRFDSIKMKPLYILEMGKPGNSFALEIARNIGLPEKVISEAKIIAGTDQVTLEDLIKSLEDERVELDQRLKELEKEEGYTRDLKHRYETLKNKLEDRQADIINDAKEEANRLIEEANREIERTIRHIRENQAQKTETRKMREQLQKVKSRLEPISKGKTRSQPKVKMGPVNAGDIVRIRKGGMKGEVVSVKDGMAEIIMGDLKTKVNVEQLEKIGKASPWKSSSGKGVDVTSKRAAFNPELDIRGKRGEEAIQEVDKFMDEALLLNERQVRILHGKGEGILRKLIRDHLKHYDFVEQISDEHIERGGAGISVVDLK